MPEQKQWEEWGKGKGQEAVERHNQPYPEETRQDVTE